MHMSILLCHNFLELLNGRVFLTCLRSCKHFVLLNALLESADGALTFGHFCAAFLDSRHIILIVGLQLSHQFVVSSHDAVVDGDGNRYIVDQISLHLLIVADLDWRLSSAAEAPVVLVYLHGLALHRLFHLDKISVLAINNML